MNVVESEKTTYWYVEKDKSWNLAAAIWYVKKDRCGWKWKKTDAWYVEKDKSWNLAAAIWYVKKDRCGWKWKKKKQQMLDMLRRIKVET